MHIFRRNRDPRAKQTDLETVQTMLKAWGHKFSESQSADMEAAKEYWLWPGANGDPVGVLYLTPDGQQSQTVHMWMAVDPKARRFGLGQHLWEHGLSRVRKLGAQEVVSWADSQTGYAFMVDHGFEALNLAQDPTSELAPKPRVDGVLKLSK